MLLCLEGLPSVTLACPFVTLGCFFVDKVCPLSLQPAPYHVNLACPVPCHYSVPARCCVQVWEITANNIIMVSAIGNDGPLWDPQQPRRPE